MAGFLRLKNPIQPYAWGSRTAIAKLQGRAKAKHPEAEMWMGAHPDAPSEVPAAADTLDRVIAANPKQYLGDTAEKYDGKLPFLFKVLAAQEPLSIQCHPSAEQALAGFERENAASIRKDAPHRNYKDPRAKPELIVALEPFSALLGFRKRAQVNAWASKLDVFELKALLQPLSMPQHPSPWSTTFERLMTVPDGAREELIKSVITRLGRLKDPAAEWVKKLNELHPGEAGVLAPLLLELYELQPGEGLYLGPGELHAYLRGTGVEIMGNSNNVLRGGLTKKHVDLPELLSVLRFDEGRREPLTPITYSAGGAYYQTPAPEFRLYKLDVRPGQQNVAPRNKRSPHILLVVQGSVMCETDGRKKGLKSGESAFLASGEKWQLSGDGVVYAAGVNLD